MEQLCIFRGVGGGELGTNKTISSVFQKGEWVLPVSMFEDTCLVMLSTNFIIDVMIHIYIANSDSDSC